MSQLVTKVLRVNMRLNFDQRPISSGLRFFNESEISDSGPRACKSLQEDLCSGFLRSEKVHRPYRGMNPRTLDFEASTLPRDHLRPTLD
jgi:hypothetical protein